MFVKYISEVIFEGGLLPSSYLNGLPVVRYLKQVERLAFSSAVTFFVGENGTGKSTLLEAIAVSYGFNAEGGSRNLNFSTKETHSELCDYIRLSKKAHPRDGFFLRAESVYNMASNIDKRDEGGSFGPKIIESYGGVSLHEQSHGESFLAIVQNRFGGNGIYLLDEPEAALSPMRQLALLTEIDRLVKAGSQFIIATHSPILMAFPGAEILEFTENGIAKTDYKDTEHYRITKQFLNDPDRMLYYLLND